MKDIGKIIAGVCAFFFVVSGAAAILLFNIEQKVFSPETYKKAFKDEGLYAQTPSLLATVLTETSNDGGGASALLSLLSKDELALVIASLLPPDEIEAVTNDALDSTFAFINSETDSVAVSLVPFKQNLIGEGGTRVFNQILQAQPDCTPDQLLQMGLNFLGSDPQLMMCNPPEEVMQLIAPLVEVQLQLITSNVPDELTLVTASQIDASNFRTRLDRIRTVMKLTFILPLLLLFALTLFAVRSLKDWLKWWGISFLAAGVSTLFLALIGTPIVRFVVVTVILQGNAGIPQVIVETMQNVFGSLASQILIPVAIEGLILAFIGTGMVVVNFLAGKAVYLPSRSNSP